MERVQPNWEEKLRNPRKITFGYLGEIVDKAKVTENKHPTKKEEENCLVTKEIIGRQLTSRSQLFTKQRKMKQQCEMNDFVKLVPKFSFLT